MTRTKGERTRRDRSDHATTRRYGVGVGACTACMHAEGREWVDFAGPFRVSAEKPAGGAVMVAVITAPGVDVVTGGGGAIVGPELGGC